MQNPQGQEPAGTTQVLPGWYLPEHQTGYDWLLSADLTLQVILQLQQTSQVLAELPAALPLSTLQSAGWLAVTTSQSPFWLAAA